MMMRTYGCKNRKRREVGIRYMYIVRVDIETERGRRRFDELVMVVVAVWWYYKWLYVCV